VGGTVLTFFGFPVLFIVAALIMHASVIPLLVTPEVFEPHDLSYGDAFRRLLRPEFRRTVVAHLGYGEEFIEQYVWPLFIVLVIPSYFEIGAVMTGAAVMMLVATFVVGRLTDEHHRHTVLRTGTLSTALSWLARLLVTSPLGVFVTASLYRVSRITIGIPYVTLDSKRAREYSVMKSVVLYEMSITVGKIAVAALALVILSLVSPGWWPLFLLAAAVTVLYAFR
jgi:MFS family permease